MPPKAGRAAPKPEPNQTDRKTAAAPTLPSVWDLGLIAERFRIMATTSTRRQRMNAR